VPFGVGTPVVVGPRPEGFATQQVFGGGFNPTSISGMRFWQEADAITGKVTDNTITTWADVSGASNDLTEATRPPVYRATDGPNSLPCVRFDGSNDSLSKTGLSGDTSFTVFIVAKKQTAVDTANRALWGTNSATALCQLFCSSDDGSATDYLYYANQAVGITVCTGAAASWNIMVVRVNSAASLDVFASGGTPTNLNPNDAVTTDTARVLGAFNNNGTSNQGDFDVYGYLEWDSALSAANMNLVGAYLAGKTAITWTAVS
jgi:hypothetical protein